MGHNADAIYAGDNMNAAWVKANNPPIQVEIADAVVKNFANEGEAKEMKIVLAFKGIEKQLALNVTNKNVLRDVHGADTDGWIGKVVHLTLIRSSYAGKPCDSILIDATGISGRPSNGLNTAAPIVQVLGPIGEQKLMAALAVQSLDIALLIQYLASQGVADLITLGKQPQHWPRGTIEPIKTWLENPAVREDDGIPF